jgi:hypothetical protein
VKRVIDFPFKLSQPSSVSVLPTLANGHHERICLDSKKNKQTPWSLVRERTIPTERPPLVNEILVSTFVDRGVSRGQRGGSPTVVNLSFLDRLFGLLYLKK